MSRLSDKTKDEIVKWLQEGNSQHSAKAKFGVSGNIVSKLAKENNIKPPEAKAAQTKNANSFRQYYTRERRLISWDGLFEKCMVRFKDDELTPFEFQKMVLALAAITDKLRQEESASDSGKYEFQELMERIRKNDKLLST